MTKVNLQFEPGVDGKLIYYSGHLLKGLHVTIFGSARAHWTKRERKYRRDLSLFGNGNRRTNDYHTVHYEGIEVYVNTRSYLFGKSGGPTFEMAPGTHRYEFTCQLPPQIPYTVGLKHAEIYYYVEAVLDIPWHFDKESKVPLIIIPYVDLNLYQHFKVPKTIETFINTCTLFCISGRLEMTIFLPYTGFAVGQKVPIKLFYNNKTNQNVVRTRITLKRIITYNATTPHPKTKSKEEDMIIFNTDGVKDGVSTSFESIFEIPRVMLCTNGWCHVVTVTYVMKIEAVLGMFSSNLTTVIPVVIGTVPIREDQLIQNTFANPKPSSYYSPVSCTQPSAPDFLPSFEEATSVPEKQNLSLMEKSMPTSIGWGM